MRTAQTLDFDAWCDAVDAIVEAESELEGYTNATGRECWRDAYEHGYSPEDAAQDEFDAWEA